MANLTVPFKAQVTYKITFLNSAGQPVDPDEVELDVGGATYKFSLAEITRTGVGLYEKTLIMDVPGRTSRIWIGSGPGAYYVESKRATINVQASLR